MANGRVPDAAPAQMLPREIVHTTMTLHHKPAATIHISLARSNDADSPRVIIVFLNGLMSDKSSWLPVMASIIRERKESSTAGPTLLAYDRYGQGLTTDTDPLDRGREKGRGHDVKDAAEDLRHLIAQVCVDGPEPRVVLVANSIGCAIARCYAQNNPVAAILFLDSIIANSSFDFWPDPDRDGFDKARDLPEDVSVEILREQRKKFAAIFRPDVANKEGLDRATLAKLLPESDKPILGKQGQQPWVTVVGHDFQTFAEESLKTMGTPISLSMRYSNPIWNEYNQGLARLTDQKLSKGPFQAKGCGHFIQRDDPTLVVQETLDLADKAKIDFWAPS